jgi:hypothetical protein
LATASPISEPTAGDGDLRRWRALGLLREGFQCEEDLAGSPLGGEQDTEGLVLSVGPDFVDVPGKVPGSNEAFDCDVAHGCRDRGSVIVSEAIEELAYG